MFSDREKVGVAYLIEPPFTEVENHETHSSHPYPRRGNKMRGSLSRQNHGDDRWIDPENTSEAHVTPYILPEFIMSMKNTFCLKLCKTVTLKGIS